MKFPAGLTFEASTHTYRYDGRIIPSVTQICPKQDLSMVPEDVLEAARLRGVRHHNIAAAVVSAGKLINMTEEDLQFQWAFEDWWDGIKDQFGAVVSIEEPYVDPKRGFAGTPDLVCEGGIVDFKLTFLSARAHALQLAGYKILTKLKARRWIILETRTDKNGVHQFKFRDVYNPHAESVFLSLLEAHKAQTSLKNYLEAA